MTPAGFGDIVSLSKWHGRRRTRRGGTQRGARMVKAPCVRGGGTTPEPPGKGPGRDPPVTVGHKRPDVRSVLPGAPRFGVTLRALRDGQLLIAPLKILPGFARPFFRSVRFVVVLLPGASALRASRVEPWDFRLTPESSSGVGLFYCLPQNTRRNHHGRRKQRV